jgi:hypothetical protein
VVCQTSGSSTPNAISPRTFALSTVGRAATPSRRCKIWRFCFSGLGHANVVQPKLRRRYWAFSDRRAGHADQREQRHADLAKKIEVRMHGHERMVAQSPHHDAQRHRDNEVDDGRA